ncbi:MAG: DUF721 domain-containing protein [Alistipes sp.]|nr:DUF721 domain-containing protein [Candidatus Alistipes equi]
MKRRTEQPIGALLETLFRSPNIARKIAEGSLPDTWRSVVGERYASYTRQVRLVRGILYVHISSSVAARELMWQRQALVNSINKQSGFDLVKDVVIQG